MKIHTIIEIPDEEVSENEDQVIKEIKVEEEEEKKESTIHGI